MLMSTAFNIKSIQNQFKVYNTSNKLLFCSLRESKSNQIKRVKLFSVIFGKDKIIFNGQYL